MSDILILSQSESEGAELERTASSLGLSPKYTAELRNALAWLKLRKYDVLVVHAYTSIEIQQELGSLLWNKNPMARLIVYEPSKGPVPPKDGSGAEAVAPESLKLYGAEYIKGDNPFQTIDPDTSDPDDSATTSRANFKIMVVEDLDSPRDIICFFIESLGFPQADGFNSAKSALSALEADPGAYNCIVTDIKMPEITGRELIESIRQHDKLRHLPVIVLTAYGTVDCLVDCLKAGASGFLVKPPKKDDLLRELARAQRISKRKLSPRLINHDEAETIREVLVDRGFI